MRIASRKLVYTSDFLVDVAIACGFADQSHFTREFKREFGRTPRDYRRHYGAPLAAAVPGTKTAAFVQ